MRAYRVAIFTVLAGTVSTAAPSPGLGVASEDHAEGAPARGPASPGRDASVEDEIERAFLPLLGKSR